MRLLCTRNTHSQGFPLKISSIDESIKGKKKNCPPHFSLMPRCQLAVRNRQELGAMLINISAPDTFNQQPQLGQCICKKKKSMNRLEFGVWESSGSMQVAIKRALSEAPLIGAAHRRQRFPNASTSSGIGITLLNVPRQEFYLFSVTPVRSPL